ncbi:group II intron reverse transcriptase/maturase [Lentibacillus daqui]|uniref:group II intron reverse transcriptase/maturase n=1 Tax=Lentibacillus daqui TaxID=2911514 RepID=UPI0022B1F814|nr:group II intron reverse transcriptase/maturase [Lentibacillus daqui]
MNQTVREEIVLKDNKLRYAEYYGMTEIFDELYQKSAEGVSFKSLMNIITSNENIQLAYRTIKRNGGSKTKGIDGVSIKDIEKLPYTTFLTIVQKKVRRYTLRKVRRVEIPKANGRKRPLGIPSIWDRITQQCILQVIEPICEAKFHKHSYGFRPQRSTENAIATCMYRMNQSRLNYVVDVDIKGFFDNVHHGKLMRQIWTMGIRDKQLLVILRKMLKAPIVLPSGETEIPTKGTPQGGILSPLLANINLNEFDWWIANQWEERTCRELKSNYNKKGYLDKGHSFTKLRNTTSLKEMYIVRYCDDFKIFCRTKSDAHKIYHAVKLWLKDRLKLPISEEKSKITDLEAESSEFLGFTLRLVSKSGKKVCHSHVAPKALKRIKHGLKRQVKQIKKMDKRRYVVREIKKYNSMIIGIHEYYKLATHVNLDFSPLNYQLLTTMHNLLRQHGLTKNGEYKGHDKGIKKYLKSKQMRYLLGYPILPLGYVQMRKPMLKKHAYNKYTPEGRLAIHRKQQSVPEWKIQWLRQHPVINERASIEFNDNRISLFVAQKGRCAITGVEFFLDDFHCHHKKLWSSTQNDSYRNLILVTKEVHTLIHATKQETIKRLLNQLALSSDQLEKLNKLRKLVNNYELPLNIEMEETYEQLTLF